MAIRAVCFDLDQTLLDDLHAERAGAACFQRHFADHLPACDDFHARWRRAALDAYDRYLAGEVDFQGQRRLRMRALFADQVLSDAECDARIAVYLDAYRQHWRLFSDVLAALAAVAHLPLAVITNAPLEPQRRKLARTGILDRFRAVLTPDSAGVPKPAPAIFHAACAALGVAPAECLHVGDHRDQDAIGARDAGLRAVWLDRDGTGGAPDGVQRIGGLADLGDLLRAP